MLMAAEGNSGLASAGSDPRAVTVGQLAAAPGPAMETSTDTIAARPPRIPRAGRPRHLGVRIALVVFALVLVVLALAALSALGVRRHLENGRDEMDQGTK